MGAAAAAAVVPSAAESGALSATVAGPIDDTQSTTYAVPAPVKASIPALTVAAAAPIGQLEAPLCARLLNGARASVTVSPTSLQLGLVALPGGWRLPQHPKPCWRNIESASLKKLHKACVTTYHLRISAAQLTSRCCLRSTMLKALPRSRRQIPNTASYKAL